MSKHPSPRVDQLRAMREWSCALFGELARVRGADLGLHGELQIASRLDQRGVARDRDAADAECCARALERECRGGRRGAERNIWRIDNVRRQGLARTHLVPAAVSCYML